MNAQQIQTKLESMKGRAYEYAKLIHVVKSYEINVEREDFTINTDKNSFSRKFASAADFFRYWFETDGNKSLDKAQDKLKINPPVDHHDDQQSLVVFEKENALTDDLITILKNSITQVQKNPGYINQAKAINNDVNSIINIAKLKLDMVKQMKSRR